MLANQHTFTFGVQLHWHVNRYHPLIAIVLAIREH